MSRLKSNFAVNSKYEAFYTGGKIQVSSDGVYMFCGCGNKVNILEIASGRIHSTIGKEEDEEISCFTLSPDNQYLILASQHLLLRQWKWKEKELVRTWKAVHVSPIVCMAFDSTSTLLATGSADFTIKIWDIEKQYCTHNLRGHQGVISVLTFHPDISKLQLYSAADDYKVRVWNLSTSQSSAVVEAHYSVVTSIAFSQDAKMAFSSGRDGVVAVWDTEQQKVIRTIPVFESVESLLLLPEDQDLSQIGVVSDVPHFVTAGSKGILRVWNSKLSKCVYQTAEVHAKYSDSHDAGKDVEKTNTQDDTQNIVQMLYNKSISGLAVVTYDQNISIIGLDKFRLKKQFSGNNDEIVDIKFLDELERYAVVATNSMYIKVFELATWDCEILYGHTDIVLSIDVFTVGNYFVSSGKDNTVRLWQIKPEQKEVKCLAVGQGHTHAVGTIAVSRLKPSFFVSGSEDQTLKLWRVPADMADLTVDIAAAFTERAHDKEICSVVVAPNDKFIASGSMDKTAKIWSAKDLSLLGVMRGHKRGVWCVQFSPVDKIWSAKDLCLLGVMRGHKRRVWCVQFSPVDKILATSSGDGTVKLWSLTDYSCVKTFEGHDCAVLKVTFLTRGMQLLSCGSDGLIKLWTIKTNECVKTLDEHEDKIWSLAVNKTEEKFISGGADSTLIEWKDVTEIELSEARAKRDDFILKEQELSNLVQQKKYLKAIGLAITMEQPFRVLNIMKEILSEGGGSERLQTTLEKLRMDQIDAVLRFAVQWNTNSKHCHEAQFVISTVLKAYSPTELRKFPNIKSSLEGLMPYTERHFARMSRLLQQSMFVEYAWFCMKGVATDGALPATSVKPNEIVIDRSKQAVDIDVNSSSESEIDIEITGTDKTDKKETAMKPSETKIDSVNKDIAGNADGTSSSESDMDSEMRDVESETVGDRDTVDAGIRDLKETRREDKPQKKVAARDKQRQKKLKQKMKLKDAHGGRTVGKLTDQFTVVKQKQLLKSQKSSSTVSVQDKKLGNKKKRKYQDSEINNNNDRDSVETEKRVKIVKQGDKKTVDVVDRKTNSKNEKNSGFKNTVGGGNKKLRAKNLKKHKQTGMR